MRFEGLDVRGGAPRAARPTCSRGGRSCVVGATAARRAAAPWSSGVSGGGPWRAEVDLGRAPRQRRPRAAAASCGRAAGSPRSRTSARSRPRRSSKTRSPSSGSPTGCSRRFTSFVAIDSEVVNRGGRPEEVRQPLPLPDGVSDLAVAQAQKLSAHAQPLPFAPAARRRRAHAEELPRSRATRSADSRASRARCLPPAPSLKPSVKVEAAPGVDAAALARALEARLRAAGIAPARCRVRRRARRRGPRHARGGPRSDDGGAPSHRARALGGGDGRPLARRHHGRRAGRALGAAATAACERTPLGSERSRDSRGTRFHTAGSAFAPHGSVRVARRPPPAALAAWRAARTATPRAAPPSPRVRGPRMDQTFPRAAVVRLAFLALLAAVAAWAAGCGGGGGTGERPSPQQPPAQQPPAQPPPTPTGPTGNPDPRRPRSRSRPPRAPESGKITFGTPGPWPVANALYGSAQGIRESPVVGITTDEAQNRWVATNTALYLFAPGATAPRRFTSADGLHLQDNPEVYCEDVKGYGFGVRQCPVLGGAVDPGIPTIVGGRPNEVFVGYFGENDGSAASVGPNGIEGDFDDPGRHSGKIDWVRVNADGTLTVVRYDLVSVAHGMQFWHNRTIQRLVFDHFVHPPSLYAGTNHGVDYLRPDLWRPQTPDPVRGFAEWVDTWLQEWIGDHLHAEAHSIVRHRALHRRDRPPPRRLEGARARRERRPLDRRQVGGRPHHLGPVAAQLVPAERGRVPQAVHERPRHAAVPAAGRDRTRREHVRRRGRAGRPGLVRERAVRALVVEGCASRGSSATRRRRCSASRTTRSATSSRSPTAGSRWRTRRPGSRSGIRRRAT